MPNTSYVVTGGAAGIGRAIVERLAREAHVVVLDVAEHLAWAQGGVELVSGDARDQRVTARAAETAEAAGQLWGWWVNNAAIFQDAGFESAPATEILDLITANLALAVTGCHTAVSHYLAHARAGSIVNVSSHQAQRAVRGALPTRRRKPQSRG